MKYAFRSSPDQLDAEIGNLLSLSRREMETQQYLTNAEEAAAWKEEMKDWYFLRSHNATALRELNAGGYGQCEEERPELQKVEHVVKPRSVSSARPELRRRSPYSVDLRQRQRALGRPRSVPASLVGGRASAPSNPALERPEAYAEVARAEPSRAEAATIRSPVKVDAQTTRSPIKPDVCDVRGTPVKVNEKSPNLKSAAAIESWLSQANERLAEAFGNVPPVAAKEGVAEVDTAVVEKETSPHRKCEQAQEPLPSSHMCDSGKRVDSMNSTGTTVYEPTTRPASSAGSHTPAVGLSSKPLEKLDIRSPSGQLNAASVDMTLSQTEAQTVSTAAAHHRAELDPLSCSPLNIAEPRETSMSEPRVPTDAAVTPTSSKPVGVSGEDRGASDSEHFSDDGFEEEEGDDPYAEDGFNASAASAEVMSDRGSSRSDASLSDVPTRGICAKAVEAVDEEEPRRSLVHRGSSASLLSCGEDSRQEGGGSRSFSQGDRSFSQGDARHTSNTAVSYDEEYEDFDGSDDEGTSSVDG
jgi:hypothetical protein